MPPPAKETGYTPHVQALEGTRNLFYAIQFVPQTNRMRGSLLVVATPRPKELRRNTAPGPHHASPQRIPLAPAKETSYTPHVQALEGTRNLYYAIQFVPQTNRMSGSLLVVPTPRPQGLTSYTEHPRSTQTQASTERGRDVGPRRTGTAQGPPTQHPDPATHRSPTPREGRQHTTRV